MLLKIERKTIDSEREKGELNGGKKGYWDVLGNTKENIGLCLMDL